MHIVTIRINNQITAKELRVIDAQGNNLGTMSREAALALAKPAEGLDLIETAPHAQPPVAKLMSYDKYRYEREKEEKKQRQAAKATAIKQIQISARAAQHDLQVKLKKLEEFFNEGHTVDIQMRLRGREKGNPTWAHQKLNEFLGMISQEYKVVIPPKVGGRGMYMQIAPKK